jgi:peptidoglycan/LPS O-acetylase OafA/YrhL
MQLGKHISAGAGFISNIVFWNEAGYFDNAADTKPLLHLWSLGIEEQFSTNSLPSEMAALYFDSICFAKVGLASTATTLSAFFK